MSLVHIFMVVYSKEGEELVMLDGVGCGFLRLRSFFWERDEKWAMCIYLHGTQLRRNIYIQLTFNQIILNIYMSG